MEKLGRAWANWNALLNALGDRLFLDFYIRVIKVVYFSSRRDVAGIEIRANHTVISNCD